jgi:hypothetical protein
MGLAILEAAIDIDPSRTSILPPSARFVDTPMHRNEPHHTDPHHNPAENLTAENHLAESCPPESVPAPQTVTEPVAPSSVARAARS